MKFNERLRSLRKQHNVSQGELAELLGITVRSYQRYEFGDREPCISKLIIIAVFFDVTIDYLVGRDGQ